MPETQKYRIPCVFTVVSLVEVEASSRQEACLDAQLAPLPPNDCWECLEDSFVVDYGSDYHVQLDDGRWDRRSPEDAA